MMMNEHVESMRLLLECALNAGNKKKSGQTGYLHHCYNPGEPEPHLPIPLVENFLFALTLLRSRLIDNIKEAKEILERLLHFQNRTDNEKEQGNFPIYLHDFPVCKDYLTGTHVAFVICWILKYFHSILGQELNGKLEAALKEAVSHAMLVYSDKKIAYSIAIKMASVAVVSGQILKDEALQNQGFQMLNALKEQTDEISWFSPADLGSITVSLLMVYPHLSNSPWKHLWEHLQKTWHRATASYAGPSFKERQQGTDPQVTLYDFVCGCFSDCLSTRALKPSMAHLEAALIPVIEEKFSVLSYPIIAEGNTQGAQWFLHHEEKYAYSCIEARDFVVLPHLEKGFHPFRLIWGDLHHAHTCVSQGNLKITQEENLSALSFELIGPVDVEDREKNREVIFFVNTHEGLEFLIAGEKSSTFRLGEEVSITDATMKIALLFTLEEGEGRFFGHRTMGNRPAQQEPRGDNRYQAYDWQVFLRTIHRSDSCRIKVSCRIQA